MKKDYFRPDFLNKNQEKISNNGLNKKKTTDINILLNRVKINKKKEFKKRVVLLSLIFLFISSLSILFLFF